MLCLNSIMAGNLVKICVSDGCPRFSKPSQEEIQSATNYVESQGDSVTFADMCQKVCDLTGYRTIGNIATDRQIRLCVVAGSAYDVPISLIDSMGMSGVIGTDANGEISLALLNQQQYPRGISTPSY